MKNYFKWYTLCLIINKNILTLFWHTREVIAQTLDEQFSNLLVSNLDILRSIEDFKDICVYGLCLLIFTAWVIKMEKFKYSLNKNPFHKYR